MKIAKDTKKMTIVDTSGSSHELTQNVDWVGDVRTCDSKVDKTPNQVTIASRVRKRITISGTEADIELHRSLDNALITKSGTSEKVLNILLWRSHRRSVAKEDTLNRLSSQLGAFAWSKKNIANTTKKTKGRVIRSVTSKTLKRNTTLQGCGGLKIDEIGGKQTASSQK
ncbi:hypothetical protein QYE76_061858 [Lolium multiflorum]|uniref:Uncharacterized protein n=1 Tax=Lolium multiflorum TaxID=4521 RepID=A0AAD8S345_LOLMU|nr:hypothetical protein QYE76_061858 [Lolium multiflorum]